MLTQVLRILNVKQEFNVFHFQTQYMSGKSNKVKNTTFNITQNKTGLGEIVANLKNKCNEESDGKTSSK